MGIKDNGKAHFKAKLSGDLFSVHVPEWDDTVYYKGAISGRKQSQILKLYDQGKTVEAVCMALIMRALDKDGEAIWRVSELTELMNEYDITVVSRVVEVCAGDEPTVDEAKKP
jgi:hypothetical protein